MNKQGKLINGKVVGGIEWTKTVLPDGTERQGYTWNPVAGCKHRCRWMMPDGKVAICYAEDVAEGVAKHAYQDGFAAHYWHPLRLNEPLKLKTPARIFLDSMSDLMGHWVPQPQIEQVFNTVHQADWHTFQLLTKNHRRLVKFRYPRNLWVGVSSPPDFMHGKRLSMLQMESMLGSSLATLRRLKRENRAQVTWMSFEPLSWDVADYVEAWPGALDWAVIGAASDGPREFPPDEADLRRLLEVLDDQGVPVFFKGNLRSLRWAADNWREEFPVELDAPEPEVTPEQGRLF